MSVRRATAASRGGFGRPFSRRQCWLVGAALLGAGGLPWAPGAARAAGLVELVAASKPSVVAVGVYNPLGSPRFTPRGTGFVVGDGLQVITNAHVVPDDLGKTFGSQIRVRVVSGPAAPSERVATLVRTDASRDLALLQIDGTRLPALALGPAAEVPEGTGVMFIGFPAGAMLGLAPVVHRGIVSSVPDMVLPPPLARGLSEQAIRQMRDDPYRIYQLDATAYPGNSGGPLIDAESGQVLGVVSMVSVKGTKESALSAPTGISYAVPVRWVRALLDAR